MEVVLEVGQLAASWNPETDRFSRWMVMVRYHHAFDGSSILSSLKMLSSQTADPYKIHPLEVVVL
jgi:hypothetical protein